MGHRALAVLPIRVYQRLASPIVGQRCKLATSGGISTMRPRASRFSPQPFTNHFGRGCQLAICHGHRHADERRRGLERVAMARAVIGCFAKSSAAPGP